MSTNMPQKAI